MFGCVYLLFSIELGQAWVSPTLITTTTPTHGIIVCHLPGICRTLVPKICVRHKMLYVFLYVDMLTCVIYNCMCSTEQQGRPELLLERYMYLLHIHIHVGLVNAQTHGINWFSLWSCCCPATYQLTCLCESESTNGLTVLLFCDVHVDIGAILNLLQCLCVIYGCRAVQTQCRDITGTAGYVL